MDMEERRFQARLAVAKSRWWSFHQRPEYQNKAYGMRYYLATFGIGFLSLVPLRQVVSSNFWEMYNLCLLFALFAIAFAALTYGMRREDKEKRRLRLQAALDFQREYPRDFAYNLL